MTTSGQQIPFQDLRLSNAELMETLAKASESVIRSGRYINGDAVRELETSLAAGCGARYCVAVSTGLDALRLILLAYMHLGKLHEGDEVIVPDNTFVATFLAVTSCNLTAVAADVNEEDYCLDFSRLPITPRTKAIIPVHLYGNPCWDKDIFSQLREKGILIIEDNAQAIGATANEEGFNGNSATGNLGDAAAISFYPAKNIGALGDAGAVLTSDEALARTVRMLANYGSREKYVHELKGYNCRMDELQAALLNVKLPMVSNIAAERGRRARLYDSLIRNPEVVKPGIYDDRKQVWHQYVIRHPRRDELRQYLRQQGIATEIHYPVPCHLQPCYRDDKQVKIYGKPVNAVRYAAEILSLPIADITDEEIGIVSQAINEF